MENKMPFLGKINCRDFWKIDCHLQQNHISYTFIENTIGSVAEDIGSAGFNTQLNEERNKGAFVMDSHAGDIDNLLSRSSRLAASSGEEDKR